MNYIKQLNFFWQKHEEHSLQALDFATYGLLLKWANNGSGKDWKNPLRIRNSTILQDLGLKDLRTLHKCRNKLQQVGLLKFIQYEKSPVTQYHLFDVETQSYPLNADVHAPPTALNAQDNAADDAVVYAEDNADNEHLHLISIKQKLKPKLKEEEEITSAAVKILHEDFLKDFFAPQHNADRLALCAQTGLMEIRKDWAEIFNAHLLTERRNHPQYHEWLKHFRSWLTLRATELKTLKNNYGKEAKSEHGKIKVNIDL